jgi:hypothetical protein
MGADTAMGDNTGDGVPQWRVAVAKGIAFTSVPWLIAVLAAYRLIVRPMHIHYADPRNYMPLLAIIVLLWPLPALNLWAAAMLWGDGRWRHRTPLILSGGSVILWGLWLVLVVTTG